MDTSSFSRFVESAACRPQLTAQQFRVYVAILAHMRATGVSNIGQRALSKALGMAVVTVRHAIDSLQHMRMITWTLGGRLRRNRFYEVLPIDQWWLESQEPRPKRTPPPAPKTREARLAQAAEMTPEQSEQVVEGLMALGYKTVDPEEFAARMAAAIAGRAGK